jgi:hypothetical protein
MEIDLNTADTDEYRHWLALLAELSRIQDALKNNPNKKGLRLARSHAYNLLADIQAMLDVVEHMQPEDKLAEDDSSA